jgi:hypothetical protein
MIQILLHPCLSVPSAVKDFLTADFTDDHGWGAAALFKNIHSPLHPCISVPSAVKDFLTADFTDDHGWGAAAPIQEPEPERVA